MSLKLAVIGCGYLGATHAACMSSLGFEVIGVDTDPVKIAMLSKGELPFYEPGLDTLLSSEIKTGRLTFTTDFSAVADADIHFICVGTPQSKDGLAADLTYVKAAVAAIAPHLKSGSLVVGKSTVPVGTAQSLRDQLAKSAPESDLAWNPEFLREGFAVEDTLTPNRLVVGVANDRAEELLKEVYKPIIDLGTPWIRADLPTSELVKV
ncbi:MAG: nucleotide sugar dehydrogenase, partial [Actinobacteria bacterium]|nr:nucleotide sugar dehydrogenase [Actinomycetota bacterium]